MWCGGIRVLWCSVLPVSALVPAVAAQVRFEVGPSIGYYRPVGSYESTRFRSGDVAGPSRGQCRNGAGG